MAVRRSLKLWLPLAGAAALACTVVVVLFQPPNAMDSDPGPRPVRAPRDTPSYAVETPPTEAPAPDALPAAAGPVGVASLEALRRLCPDPWSDGVPDECTAALADRYLGEGMRTVRLHYGGDGWRPPSDPLPVEISWEEAFADPVGTRDAVEEALRDPQCGEFVVRETAELFGMADVWEDPVPERLREACAADEAARLAMLHEGCVNLLHGAGRLVLVPELSTPADEVAGFELRQRDTAFHNEKYWGWLVEELDDDATLTPEEYWRRREEIEDGRFRFAWRRLRCRAVDPGVFAVLDALPEAGHDIHQASHLRRYAARLGNEWAIAVAQRFENETSDRN